jgi:hypothetical protein
LAVHAGAKEILAVLARNSTRAGEVVGELRCGILKGPLDVLAGEHYQWRASSANIGGDIEWGV